MQVPLHEAAAQLSALGKRAWAGERIVIAQDGEPSPERAEAAARTVQRQDQNKRRLHGNARRCDRLLLWGGGMKRRLLDTHVLLWWLADDPKLGPQTVELISDTRNEIFVSAASSWEIAIKKKLGKLEAPDD